MKSANSSFIDCVSLIGILLINGLFWVVPLEAQESAKSRIEYLEETFLLNEPKDHRHSISLRVSLQDSTWKQWQARTGELPPDFSKMKSSLSLPIPLQWKGKKITTKSEWEQKKAWIKEQYQYWVSGHFPPAPRNMKVTILKERVENGVRIQWISLNFGPSQQARMRFELMIPPGNERRPVYMTQWTHKDWAHVALRRGYITCVYAGADGMDDTQAYQRLYPDYDFTCLMRRAWGASRVVDYLLTRNEVDSKRIAITGHSRNGKQSLWAAAFDSRIAAVVSSSCGTGGVTPFRYTDPQYCTQTIDDIASNAAHWFQPRLRFFFGHEDCLPIDQNLLLSLIAPRSLLLHYAIVERQISPWAVEQCYQSVKTVYSWMNATHHIGIFPRMGEHPVMTRDIERCIDFLDIQFGRRHEVWKNKLYYDFSFDKWKNLYARQFDYRIIKQEKLQKPIRQEVFEKQRESIQTKLKWLLGEEPAGVVSTGIQFSSADRQDWVSLITGRPKVVNSNNLSIAPYFAMNDHLSGYLYSPDTTKNRNIPVVIYLHPYAHAHGSAYGYKSFNSPNNQEIFQQFVDHGIAVLTIDMIGFGTRIDEGAAFYDRYPRWSKMGKMVADVKACVDAIYQIGFLDKEKVFVMGNTLGGSVGVIAAAMDKRITGVIALSGISLWRSNRSPGSIKDFADTNGFIPRLGLWMDHRSMVPVDYPEILACIAPRRLYLVAPSIDKHICLEDIRSSVADIRDIYKLYGKERYLSLSEPKEINRLTNAMLQEILDYLKKDL